MTPQRIKAYSERFLGILRHVGEGLISDSMALTASSDLLTDFLAEQGVEESPESLWSAAEELQDISFPSHPFLGERADLSSVETSDSIERWKARAVADFAASAEGYGSEAESRGGEILYEFIDQAGLLPKDVKE